MSDETDKSPRDMSPTEWLASVRARYGLTGRCALRAGWLDDFLDRLPESERQKAKEIWIARRSISAATVLDEQMTEYLDQLLPVLRPDERSIAESTLFGLLPTHKFNAYAGRTPRGDRIVILHHTLVHTLNCWSHWYLRTKEEANAGYLHHDPGALIKALDYFLSIWLGEIPTGPLPDIYPKTLDSWQLQDTVVFAATAFVIGHEIGHIMLNHSGYSADRSNNHSMEFAADRIGISIAIRHSVVKSAVRRADTYHTKFALFAPLFALAVMSLFGDHSSNTHPSPSERRAALLLTYEPELRLILRERFDEFMDDVDPDFIGRFDHNSEGLFGLFAEYRELLSEMKSLRPFPETPWLDIEFAGTWS